MVPTALHDLLKSPDPVAVIATKMAAARREKRAGPLDDAGKWLGEQGSNLSQWFGKQDPSLRYGLMGAGIGGAGGLGLSAFGSRKKNPWTTALSGALAGGALGASVPLMQSAWQNYQGTNADSAGPEKVLADQAKHRPLAYGVSDAIGGTWDAATSLLPGGNPDHSLIPAAIGAGVTGAGLSGMRHLPGSSIAQKAQTDSLPKGFNKVTRGLSGLGEAREQYITGRNVTDRITAPLGEKGKPGQIPTAAESLERLRGQAAPPAPLGPVPTPTNGSAGSAGKGAKGGKSAPAPLLPGLAEGTAQDVSKILDNSKLNKFQQRYQTGKAIAPHLRATPGAGGKAVRGRTWKDLVTNLAIMAAGGAVGDFIGHAPQYHLGN